MLDVLVGLGLVLKRRQAALVVGAEALVNERHGTITLEVGDRGNGSVDGKLAVVDTQTVTVSVGVGEETRLEDGICGGLDTGDEMGGRERSLLDLGEVVADVLVENDLSNGPERELLVWPDLGKIKDVVAEALGLLCGHGLL